MISFYKGIHIFLAILCISLDISHAQDSRAIVLDSTDFKIDLLPFCNLKSNYFAAQPYKNGIAFSSNINKDWGVIYYAEQNDQNFSDLYFVEQKTDGYWHKLKSLSVAINSYLNEGAFCFLDSFNIIYYTTNNEVGKKKVLSSNTAVPLKIYKASQHKEKWTNIEPFIFNNDLYNVAHPSLSNDGKKIFFSSDMPGGLGGTDLYVCYWHQSQWSKPVNLGKHINTSGNEKFPHITNSGILYFSSDKAKNGLGNLDIYSSEFINSEWKNVRNMGAPINSAQDDFSFYLDEKKLNGYISSNRIDGIHDQIYKFQWFKSECQKNKEVEYCYTFFEKGSMSTEKLPLAYEWDLGDGTKIKGLEAQHCYAYSGDYTVQLNIIDTTTNQIFFTESSYQINLAPITTPYIEMKGKLQPLEPINFNGSKSKLSKGKITDLVWDFGDGQKAMGLKAKHTYTNLGKYLITLYAQGKDTLNKNIEDCVYKYISITQDGNPPIEMDEDSITEFTEVAQTLYSNSNNDSVTYKVQIKQSDKPIPINPENFNGLKDVKEYKDKGIYGYTVGSSKQLDVLYPLYNEVKVRGFKQAKVISFDKNNKPLHKRDSVSKFRVNDMAYTRISGRTISRYGDPLAAKIIVENLTTGAKVKEINASEEDGKFSIELNNDNLYGFYAEKDSFYSVSNFIDLRQEERHLEIKKNIEMIPLNELNEENLALRINNLFFGTKEYNLDKTSYPELNRLAIIIKKSINVKIEICGHTDNVGEENYNIELSLKRANTVKDYLVKSGCNANQISVKGLGPSQPLVSNNSEKGKYINRRVEIKFINN